jgi:serine phosphatase RsbU (regulator of sigma subunit)
MSSKAEFLHILSPESAKKKYLLSAMRGSNLDGYILVLARPYEIIDSKITTLRRNLQILAILVFALAIFSAGITSSLLLQPLGTLRVALEAVAAGNFRVQIPGATVSEFAAMLGSLSRTMSNFQELQVARTVQTTLWPEEALVGEDWQLYGRCITATELGGDHYDWMRLPDGRILLAIGDVTGHGIAPAMIQASIKVWLALNAEKCDSALALLQMISRLHFKYGARKLYMTCWLGYYTPATGRLEYASAGHPYPIIVSAGGDVEILKLPGMPLGVKENPTIMGDHRILEPGSSIILFTDGIVETTDLKNRMIGFDGFSALCRQTAGMSVESAAEAIFSAAAAWGERVDDQTVIILKRSPSAISNGEPYENS